MDAEEKGDDEVLDIEKRWQAFEMAPVLESLEKIFVTRKAGRSPPYAMSGVVHKHRLQDLRVAQG